MCIGDQAYQCQPSRTLSYLTFRAISRQRSTSSPFLRTVRYGSRFLDQPPPQSVCKLSTEEDDFISVPTIHQSPICDSVRVSHPGGLAWIYLHPSEIDSTRHAAVLLCPANLISLISLRRQEEWASGRCTWTRTIPTQTIFNSVFLFVAVRPMQESHVPPKHVLSTLSTPRVVSCSLPPRCCKMNL